MDDAEPPPESVAACPSPSHDESTHVALDTGAGSEARESFVALRTQNPGTQKNDKFLDSLNYVLWFFEIGWIPSAMLSRT